MNFITENLTIIIISVCIILFIRIVFLRAIKKDQLAVIYERDEYIKTKTSGYIIRSHYRDNEMYSIYEAENPKRENIFLIDKNEVNTIEAYIAAVKDENCVEGYFWAEFKITPTCHFDKSFGYVFDDYIMYMKQEATNKLLQPPVEDTHEENVNIHKDLVENANKEFLSSGIETVIVVEEDRSYPLGSRVEYIKSLIETDERIRKDRLELEQILDEFEDDIISDYIDDTIKVKNNDDSNTSRRKPKVIK